jgi:hypothetical protein
MAAPVIERQGRVVSRARAVWCSATPSSKEEGATWRAVTGARSGATEEARRAGQRKKKAE